MSHKMLVLIAATTGVAACSGDAKQVSCPSNTNRVEINPDDFDRPELADTYVGEAVCLSKEQSQVTKGIEFQVPTILGDYMYDDFGTPSAPTIVLDASDGEGGASLWQNHGCAQVDMTWGIELKEGDGPAIYNMGVGGVQLRIWAMTHGPCLYECTPGLICDDTKVGTSTPGSENKWIIANYVIATPQSAMDNDLPGQISIFGERWLQP